MAKKNEVKESTYALSRQAATWLVLLKERRGLSLQEGRQFLSWLVRSHRHVYEFLLICRQDARLTRVLRAPRHARHVIHLSWRRSPSPPAQPAGRHHRIGWNSAALVVLVLAVLFSFNSGNDKPPNGPTEPPSGPVEAPDNAVAIAAKKPTTQRLADGTRVALEAGTALRVEFSATRRDVQVLEGKARFEVAKDPNRPFVVNTPWIEIAANEGSEFAVTIDSIVEVAVYSGLVDIFGRGVNARAQRITVKEGETYRVPVDQFREIVAQRRGGLTGLSEG